MLRARDVPDPTVPEGHEVRDGVLDAGPVIEADRGQQALGRAADRDGGQAELGKGAGSGVVHAQVGEEHPVDAAVGREPAVAVELRRGIARDLQHQHVSAASQHRLDTCNERREERVGTEQLGLPGEAHGMCAAHGQRPGRGAGSPAELGRHREDPFPRVLGDPGTPIEGKGNRALRDLGDPRDVDDGGSTGEPLASGHKAT